MSGILDFIGQLDKRYRRRPAGPASATVQAANPTSYTADVLLPGVTTPVNIPVSGYLPAAGDVVAIDWRQDGDPLITGTLAAGPNWTAYTPTWTALYGGTTTLGNGTLAGAYLRIGHACHVHIFFQFGSSTSSSTGADDYWAFSLPFTVVAPATGVNIMAAMCGVAADAVPGWYPITAHAGMTATDVLVQSGGASLVKYNTPFTWTTGAYLTIGGTYPV